MDDELNLCEQPIEKQSSSNNDTHHRKRLFTDKDNSVDDTSDQKIHLP